MCGSGQHGTENMKHKLLSFKCVAVFFGCLFVPFDMS